jgi:hypothetical protein
MTFPKEPRYFSDGKSSNRHRGIDWYRSLFAPGVHARARGEASTDYAKAPLWPETPRRIADLLPDVRLLYVMRDPIDRIRSHYGFLVQRGAASRSHSGEDRPINRAVLEDPRYVDSSRYAFQLERYLEHFDRSSLFLLWADDLRDRRAETVGRALEFIGVDPDVGQIRKVLGKEFHRSDDIRQPWRWQATAARLARLSPLRFLKPETKRRLYRSTARVVEPPDTTLEQAVEAELWDRLVDDSIRLEAIAGEAPPWLARRAREGSAT